MKDEKVWVIGSGKNVTELRYDLYSEINKDFGKKYSTLSVAYKTKEELIIGEKVLPEPCKECGGIVKTNYYDNERMIEKNLCFSCNFWDEKVSAIRDSDRHYIVDGGLYYRKDDALNSVFQGFGGRLFKIKRFESDKVIETRNLWFNGEVPDLFKGKLKNNAEFIR